MSIEIYTANLPEHLAAYAMYGDDSTTGDDSEIAYDQWLDDTMKHERFESIFLVDVPAISNGFMSYHELKDYGIGSCDSTDFVFHVKRKAAI